MLKPGAVRLGTLLVGLAALGCKPESKNVSYVAGGTDSLQTLDIYSPTGDNNHPVMIFIHGGSFTTGDKRDAMKNKVQAFGRSGYVLVSINYRLAFASKSPDQIQDVARAIGWVHANIERYGGDPDRIYVMGHSSGAHLAAWIGTDERFLQAEGLGLGSLRGVILLEGNGYDLPLRLATARDSSEKSYQQLLANLTRLFGHDSTNLREASPVYHVAAGKGIPPFLIIYRTNISDGSIGIQARALHNALVAAGSSSELKTEPNPDHYQLNNALGVEGDQATGDVFAFLDRVDQAGKP